ncbi:protein FAM189B-like [Sinocyclocheilus anshuiensis]|uniref:protein FAM189B-like n=1 Tax=Sinocyclocheilus anshuiensis TaxID=1608454 RepID=UPI0007B8F4D1|nr:PREDICTED: protein FAM189B-like [Sinocyclocheilus anshuiensis]
MPSPSDSSSVASMSGSRALSGNRRGMSGRTSARVLLYLGLCHLALGAMVLAFSFTSLAFTSSPRVRQSCPFWAGFFVVASGVVGVISWRRPFTLVVRIFIILTGCLCVCLLLLVSAVMLFLFRSGVAVHMENRLCLCCDLKQTCSPTEDETLVLYQHTDCHSVRHQLKDLLFSACGLSILSTIICTLSTVTCSIHIFSLDLMHLLAPHRSRSVNPECTTPQDAFLSNMMDFEEFVPPIPPPPYYPPEYTCSSETDAQSVTYNGSMGSPVPLYPTDCPPPYEAVIGQRAPSQATVFDTQAGELSGERGTSTAFSGEVSMDSGSLLMSEIVDIPDDSSPSEDSYVMEVGVGMRARPRGGSEGGEGGDYASLRSSAQHPKRMVAAPSGRCCFRGERSNSCSCPSSYITSTYRSPVLRRQALLASSCSQLEFLAGSKHSCIPEIRVRPCTPSRQDSSSAFTNPPTAAPSGPAQDRPDHTVPVLLLRPGFREQIGRDRKDSDVFLPLLRSHSEPGLSSSTDTGDFSHSGGNKGVSEGGSQTSPETGVSSGAGLLPRSSFALPASLPRKGSIKTVSTRLPSKQVPATSLRLPKDCARSLGDLKVTKVLVQRFLQRSKRNLALATEHAGNCTQGPKRRTGSEGLPLEQVLRNSLGANRGQQQHVHHHCRGHHHSHSDSRHNAPRRHDDDPVRAGGIHLRSCGDLNSTSIASLRRLHPPSHGSSGALYSESAL